MKQAFTSNLLGECPNQMMHSKYHWDYESLMMTQANKVFRYSAQLYQDEDIFRISESISISHSSRNL